MTKHSLEKVWSLEKKHSIIIELKTPSEYIRSDPKAYGAITTCNIN